jgi:hypothetical protein
VRKFLALLFFAASALAQNTVTVTAANIHNGSSGLLSAGTILFQAVNSSGQNISYQLGATGPSLTAPTICSISNGAITGTCTVPNVATALPQNFCFEVTVKSNSNTVVLGGPGSPYMCVQPVQYSSWCANYVCDFDYYSPTIPNSVLVISLAPAGTNSLGGIYASYCQAGYVVNGYNSQGIAQCVPGGGGGGVWGTITGTLSSQTDLWTVLQSLAPLASPTFSGTVRTTNLNVGGTATLNNVNATNGAFTSLSGTFSSNTTTAGLVLQPAVTNPGGATQQGSVWFNSVGPTGFGDITFYDVNGGYQSVLTNNMTPAQMANGVTGTGSTVLSSSPVFTGVPNIGNAVGISLTLYSTTGDNMDLQPGTVTPYIQASPASGHIKTGYGSDNRWQLSNGTLAFSDITVASDNLNAVYNHSGTQSVAAHVATDVGTLSSGTLAVVFTGVSAFSTSSSYFCTANDTTAANAIKVTYTSGTQVTFTGTSTDSFRYICIGT